MRKHGGLIVGLVVVTILIAAFYLPEVTVSVDKAEPFQRQFGVQDERTTAPIPWLVVSVLAIGLAIWLGPKFIRWWDRHDD